MVHSENSKMINDYIKLYQNGKITLEGLWYNIQTPLFLLFKKEESIQVLESRIQEQEKRIQEQNSDIVIWDFEYKQKEAALALFVRSFNSLKEEIIELKKQQDYWYVEKVGCEKKELALKAEISDLKKQLDALKKESRNGWFWWS